MVDEPLNTGPLDLEKMLEDASRKASEDQFWATRGKAVQAYARVEQALCRIFVDVSGMSQQVAAIVFFRITSASARLDVWRAATAWRYQRRAGSPK